MYKAGRISKNKLIVNYKGKENNLIQKLQVKNT